MAVFFNRVKSRIKKIIGKLVPPELMPLIKHLHSKGLYLDKNNIVLNKISVEKALILAPHPDDEIIGMGGVLRMYLEAGSDVTVLYLTDGRHDGSGLGFSKMEMIEIRRKEAESMGKWYNIKQIFWPIEDTCLTNDEETVSRMIRVLKDLRPEVIYLPSFFDHHFDHFSANTVLAESLKRLSDFQVNIAGYEVWDNIPFPNYIVDISTCFAEKKKMLSYYTIPLKKVNYINLCDNRNALHYTLYVDPMKDGRAEAFCYWDSDTYQELYRDYLEALKKFKSNLISRVR